MNIDNAHDLNISLQHKVYKTDCEDECPWYAIRLFNSCQKGVSEALKALQLECFIPMEYVDINTEGQILQFKLRPVIHNLLFLKKTKTEQEIRNILTDMPYRLSVIRKDDVHTDSSEIPARQMFEFQAMCNPDILMRKYLSEDEAKLKAGTPVTVQHGPLNGMTGRLVRSNKKYFLLKEVPGMGVMLKVSRWCCKPLNEF